MSFGSDPTWASGSASAVAADLRWWVTTSTTVLTLNVANVSNGVLQDSATVFYICIGRQ